MHFWNRWLGEHGRRNRRDYLRRRRDRDRHVWKLMVMETLKTYAWFLRSRSGDMFSRMLHMLSTLKLILYGFGVSVRKNLRARR